MNFKFKYPIFKLRYTYSAKFKIFLLVSQLLVTGAFSSQPFRLITYNILSDDYLWDGVYNYVNEDVLLWENRRIKIVERIKKLDADIVCLQELNTSSYEYFSAELETFTGAFAKKGSHSEDGVGTFCKKDVFVKIHHQVILCDGTSNCGDHAIQPALFTTIHFTNDPPITLINTKIKWSLNFHPGDPISNHVQFILNSLPNTSLILVGDFNMKPDHLLMRRFFLAGLKDSFSEVPICSCYANGEFQRIDYILTSKEINTFPYNPIENPGKPIPNEDEPSDHLPIGCIISHE